MTTRTPTGGSAGDDLETLLRTELGAVADAVGADGRPAPTTSLLARGRTARRRRQAALTGGAALATAAVLAIGFGVVNPSLRADSGPSVQTPTPSERTPVTTAELETWIRSLPVGDVPALPLKSSQGKVAWDGQVTQLPDVQGLSRFAVPFGSADRGLLLGWFTEASGDNPPIQLGWLAPDGRWTTVDTLHLTGAAVSPDGATYVYTGSPATGAAGSVPTGKAFVQERKVADDAAATRLSIPDGSYVRGWFDGGWLLTHDDGTHPGVLKDGGLVPRDLIPTAPDGGAPIAITSVHGDPVHGEVVTYTMPSFQGCPAANGASTVLFLANRYENGTEAGRVSLGCFQADSDPVSPDGTHYVAGGDEFTIRSTASITDPPALVVGPQIAQGTTVVTWEPDSGHVQIEFVEYDASGTPVGVPGTSRFTVRCAVAGGSCVRNV